MPRFFIDTSQIDGSSLSVLGEDARHIARSLRMAVGDSITVATPDGTEHVCTLTKIRDERCDADIISSSPSAAEPRSRIILFMAYPKSDKLETVIQKAVELGASKIVPFESSRCIKKPDAAKAEARTERLNRIAAEAAKQCGRGILPSVSAPIGYNAMLRAANEADDVIFCYEGSGTRSLKAILSEMQSAPASISVIVGCEGGFSPEEAAAAQDAGMKMANLGPRILRCETAPAYVLSAISYHFELSNG